MTIVLRIFGACIAIFFLGHQLLGAGQVFRRDIDHTAFPISRRLGHLLVDARLARHFLGQIFQRLGLRLQISHRFRPFCRC
jgi:hypothetical protein